MVTKFLAGKAITAVLLGNSIGIGYYSSTYEVIPSISEYSGELLANERTSNKPGGHASLLRKFLKSKNESSELINLSGSGWDTNDHLGIALPSTAVAPHKSLIDGIFLMQPKPDVVFIPLQINDANHNIDISVFYKNTSFIVRSIKSAGIDVVLVKENYADIPGYSAYVSYIDDIAREQGVQVIDTYTPSLGRKDLLFDYAHPNEKGHELIFEQYRKWFLSAQPPS